MAEAVEKAVVDCSVVEALSFYGLVRILGQVDELLDRAAAAGPSPSQDNQDILDRRDSLEAAQSRLRREMGIRLQDPKLTKKEKPMAEDFLQKQVRKLSKDAKNENVLKTIERLTDILAGVRGAKIVPESRAVTQAQASIQELEAEWKEISPLYDKWEKGKHSFKSNADLQTFKRRYEDCKKARLKSSERLEEALCRHSEARTEALVQDGFSAVEKLKAPKVATPLRAISDGRGAMAKKLDAVSAKPERKKGPSAASAWEGMPFAARLRAEMTAQVKSEYQQEGEEDEAEEPEPRSPPPPRAGFWGESEGDDAEGPTSPASDRPKGKKKADEEEEGKKKGKKKGGGATKAVIKASKERAEAAERPSEQRKPSTGSKMAAAFTATYEGSAMQQLLKANAWSIPDEDEAMTRLDGLGERIHWSSPLGLSLPLTWAEFLALEMDGGPKSTSRRGSPGWVVRLQSNVPWLLTHYLQVIFFLMLLHALYDFGLLLWLSAVQAALILAPPEVNAKVSTPARAYALQGVHLVLWLMYVRALVFAPFFAKVFLVAGCCCHAYVLRPPDEAEKCRDD